MTPSCASFQSAGVFFSLIKSGRIPSQTTTTTRRWSFGSSAGGTPLAESPHRIDAKMRTITRYLKNMFTSVRRFSQIGRRDPSLSCLPPVAEGSRTRRAEIGKSHVDLYSCLLASFDGSNFCCSFLGCSARLRDRGPAYSHCTGVGLALQHDGRSGQRTHCFRCKTRRGRENSPPRVVPRRGNRERRWEGASQI